MLILKSIGAVLVGFVVVPILSFGMNMVLSTVGFFPSMTQPELYTSWILLIALAYTAAFCVLGGYIAARLAPRYPLRHVAVLALLGFIGGIAGAAANWEIMPHWYCLASLIVGPVGALLGGKLYENSRG